MHSLSTVENDILKAMKDRNTVRGTVLESLPGTMFKVQAADGRTILCGICGRMRINNIRVLPGDVVEFIPSDDWNRGRIEKRFK